MEIVHHSLADAAPELPRVRLAVDRLTLAKRRWRGTAEDGQEFGFDLEHPLADGDAFFRTDAAIYIIEQKPEPVLELAADTDPARAAQLGWTIGNLHFPLALAGAAILVPDDPALRQLFAREHIPFTPREAVFQPLRTAHSHAHPAAEQHHH